MKVGLERAAVAWARAKRSLMARHVDISD
jgi:hypothetical protein